MGKGREAGPDVISALAGKQADQDRACGYKTRRVVLASLGVIQEQQAGRKRVRAVALASILVVVLLLGPMMWWAAENLIAEGHMGALASQFACWVCILCPALVAAALVAGWAKNRS
jgi:hypothetical protein